MHWYYEEKGQQVGPLTDDQFRQAVESERILQNTLVWNETLSGWTQYGTLLPAAPPALPKQPPVVPPRLQTCSQCNKKSPEQNLIQYGGLWVCGSCKTVFFQRLKEEGTVSAIWRDRKLLVAANQTALPDRCVKCNAPAHGIKMTKKFYWHPPLLYLLICAGFLIYAIVALIVRKTSTLQLGICEHHRSKRKRNILISWIAVAFSFVLIFAGASSESGAVALFGGLLLFAAIIFGLVTTQLLVPTKIDNQSVVWLKGVPESYLQGLPSYRAV